MAIEWEDGAARMGGVALIQIEGPLSRCAGWWSMGYDEILEAHDEAFRSDARAVLQVHHSPGGYISGLDETERELSKMAREYGKPLHALSADAMYSASYRLACPASKRWITRAGGAGSVGTIVTRADYSKANELAGIRIEQIASGECKTDGDPDVPITKAEIARVRERVDFHTALFVGAVSRATGLSTADVLGQQAAIYLGQNAVTARLADGVSTLAECVARLEAETAIQGRSMVTVPNGPRGQQQTAGNKHMEMGMLALALGLAADAKDQDVTARASALVGVDTKLRELTGKSDPTAALAVIEGWREGSAKLAEANAQLKIITDREEASAYKALVKIGEDSAQITPANRAKVIEKFPTAATLSAYLETAPAALPGQATAGITAAHKGGAAGATEAKTDAVPKLDGKAYADLSYAARAAWSKSDPDNWAAAKADYDRTKGG
jgi:ClpP class serine protease